MTIYTGDTVRLEATFQNFSEVNTAPATVKVLYKNPSGTTTEDTFATSGAGGWLNPSTGVYSFDLEVTVAGTWIYGFEGTGPVDKYHATSFIVRARPTS